MNASLSFSSRRTTKTNKNSRFAKATDGCYGVTGVLVFLISLLLPAHPGLYLKTLKVIGAVGVGAVMKSEHTKSGIRKGGLTAGTTSRRKGIDAIRARRARCEPPGFLLSPMAKRADSAVGVPAGTCANEGSLSARAQATLGMGSLGTHRIMPQHTVPGSGTAARGDAGSPRRHALELRKRHRRQKFLGSQNGICDRRLGKIAHQFGTPEP